MFPSPVSFVASRKVRDSFGVQNGFFFQAWTQAFFWLRASRKPAAAAGIRNERMKKKERKKREKGTKEKTFSSFLLGQLAPTASISRSFQLRTAEDGVLLFFITVPEIRRADAAKGKECCVSTSSFFPLFHFFSFFRI